MQILVTGGAGFIGSHLVDALVKEDHRVIVVDNLSSGKKEYINPNVRFYNTDIRSDMFAKIFTKHKFDTVFHLAAQTSVTESINGPLRDYSINVEGSLNVITLSRNFDVRKIVFASTVGVYGEHQYLPIDEFHPTQPINPYGKNKLKAEELFNNGKIDYTILRYVNVYGPRQNAALEAGVVAIFINKMLKDERVEIYDDGNQERDFVYVDDVVAATVSAMSNGSGKVINIGTGKGTSINELFTVISSLVGYKRQPLYRGKRDGELYKSIVDTIQVEKILDWRPKVNLNEGLRIFLTYQKNARF